MTAAPRDGTVPGKPDRTSAAGRHKTGLRTLLALLVLGTSGPLLVFSALLMRASWEQQLAIVDRQHIETARAISVALDKEVERVQAALRVLASLEMLNEPDLERFETIALRLAPRQSWHSLILTTPSGEVLYDSSVEPDEASRLWDSEWAMRTGEARQAVVSNLLESPAGEQLFAIAVPVIRAGELTLVLAARLPARSLSDVLNRQNVPPGGVVALLDGRRKIMARTRGEAQYVGGPPSAGFLEASRRMAEGSWREDILLEGTRAYAALSRSQLTGWTLGIAVAAEEIDGPIRQSLWLLAGVAALVLGLGAALAVTLGGRIVGTLAAAAHAAHALAHGRPVAVPPSRIAEFDHLASGMREAAAILEKRSRERDLAFDAERTARRDSEAQEARLEVTLESIADAVVTTDVAGRVTMLNPAAEALTGWAKHAAYGEPVQAVVRIIDEESRNAVAHPVGALLRGEAGARSERPTLLLARDGRELPIEHSAAPIRAAKGELLGIIIVFRDVSEARKAELDRQRSLEREQAARREAEALSREKDEFVATVSHELRTPLHAMFGWVQLLLQGMLDDRGKAHAIEILDRNVRIQAQLIDDLLEMSRALTGNLHLELRRLDMLPVLEASLDVVRPAAQAKDISLVLKVDDRPGPVAADPDRLQQIIWNLLANSVKFTPKGGHVELVLSSEGGDAIVQVADDGIGISADLLPHVFERFRQGKPAAEGGGGLGIGLALVRYLVELHGGTVHAASGGKGRGATFTVRLPILGIGRTLPEVEGPQTLPAHAVRPLQGKRVLIVEDDADAREAVAMILSHAGAAPLQAASAAEALASLAHAPVDVMLCDIGMPGATGYDLVQQIRATPATAEIPVIALTAYARLEDRERALASGFDEHVGKPVDPQALVGTIERLLCPRYPPAIAPTMRNGKAPDATGSGKGASGES